MTRQNCRVLPFLCGLAPQPAFVLPVILSAAKNLTFSILFTLMPRKGRSPQRPAGFSLSVILSKAKNLFSPILFSHFARGERLLVYAKSHQKRSGLRPAPSADFLHISDILTGEYPYAADSAGQRLPKAERHIETQDTADYGVASFACAVHFIVGLCPLATKM